MRVALISDVHGNLFPLEAVAHDIGHRSVQSTICLGDTATVGNQPRQVLEVLQGLNCRFIMGNHDEALLDLRRAADLHIPPEFIPTLQWTLKEITRGQIEFIRSFKRTLSLEMENTIELFCYHGSPSASHELVSQTMSEEDLLKVFQGNNASIFAGGHIHQPMVRRLGSRLVINPGSIGCAWVWIAKGVDPILQPWAEYAIVDVGKDWTNVELMRVPFDTERARKDTFETDNPMKEWWLKQYRS